MKRALGPAPSRCGCFALSWISWPRLNIRVTCLLATCTKLAMLSLQANVIVPYCTRSVIRSSAPRIVSRTRCIAGSPFGFLSRNQRSTSAFFNWRYAFGGLRRDRSGPGLEDVDPGADRSPQQWAHQIDPEVRPSCLLEQRGARRGTES